MPQLKLKNTYTRTVEELPANPNGQVLLYSCGPTVYSYAHIGNFRTFLLGDILRRVLEQRGHSVRHVMNITDVGHMTEDHLADATGEDKLARAARELGWDPFAVAAHFERAFVEDAVKLRLKNYLGPEKDAADLHPRATEHIPEMLVMIQSLLERKHAYVAADGQVYFEVKTFHEYGALSGKHIEELEAGARIDVRNEKRDPRDFALWKVDKKHLMKWDPHGPSGWAPGHYERFRKLAPAGVDPAIRPGFPGWHIECSAMSRSCLGPVIDLHTGGEDNIFPHHECEIAQSYGARATDQAPNNFCRFWLHSRHLLVNGAKMSKRDGTLITPRELFDPRKSNREDLARQLEDAGFRAGCVPPRVLRFALISVPFTQPMNFTIDVLVQARASVERIDALYWRLPADDAATEANSEIAEAVARATEGFDEAMCDNLNTSKALAEVFGVVSAAYQRPSISGADARVLRKFFERSDEVFALIERESRAGFLSTAELEKFAEEPSTPVCPDGEDPTWIRAALIERFRARRDRDYAKADEIRKILATHDVQTEDSRGGIRWRLRGC